jgi:hypothetical protein
MPSTRYPLGPEARTHGSSFTPLAAQISSAAWVMLWVNVKPPCEGPCRWVKISALGASNTLAMCAMTPGQVEGSRAAS